MTNSDQYNDPYHIPLNELLYLTETHVTPEAELGYEYAKIALERARKPEESAKFPTAEVIAARQAGFRGAQAGEDEGIVWHFFSDSLTALENKKFPHEHARERIGTYVLAGRTALLLNSRTAPLLNSGNPSNWFKTANRELSAQHRKGAKWDRFGTMNDKFWATHEAMNGDARKGARLALRGIYRARYAQQENATKKEHKKFVRKQTWLNVAAGVLAISRGIDFGLIKKGREKLARKIIEGPRRRAK